MEMPFGSSFEDSSRLIITIIRAIIINTTTHRFMNGNPGINILNPSERGIDTMAAQSTEFGLVLFQNNPKIKMAKIAGVVKPVYS